MSPLLLPQLCIHILKKNSKLDIDNLFLHKVLRNLSIFKQDSSDKSDVDLSNIWESAQASQQLFKGLQYEFIKKRTTLFSMGDIGFHYYIVLGGRMATLILDPSKQDLSPEELAALTAKEHSKEHKKDLSDEEFLQKHFPLLKNVAEFKAGSGFGEIALLTKSKR